MAVSADDFPPTIVRTDVHGLKVVKDEVYQSPASRRFHRFIAVKGVRVLTLEDDSVVLGCADCLFVGKFRQISAHREAEHTVAVGDAGRRADGDDGARMVVPRETMSMTLREIVETAVNVDSWGTLLGNQEAHIRELVEERDELRRRLRATERELTGLKKRIARAMRLQIVETADETEES